MQTTNRGDVHLQAFFDLLARDYIEDAVKRLRKAVNDGNLRAMYWLGKLYRNGWLGCQKSLKRAIEMWNKSLEYGPSSVALRRDLDIMSHHEPTLDSALARALYWTSLRTMHNQADIDDCRGVFLEYYHLAARNSREIEVKLVYLNEGADKGCTQCLLDLYDCGQLLAWQHRRRLWRHCPARTFEYVNAPLNTFCFGYNYVEQFGCKENARHIVCLLEWARRTRESAALATLPRDVLRLVCVRLLRTSLEQNQDDERVWNYWPEKKTRSAKRIKLK
jgi:hypothetical protein